MNIRHLHILAILARTLAAQADEQAPQGVWSITIEHLAISASAESALQFVPALNDEQRSEETVRTIQKEVSAGRVELVAWQKTCTVNGERSVSETLVEQHYPTEFLPPDAIPKPIENPTDLIVPTAFETRNTGFTLEVEPTVSPDGRTISLQLCLQSVRLLGFRRFESLINKAGVRVRHDQPDFHTTRTTANLTAPNGRWMLLSANKQPAPDEGFDLSLIRVTAKNSDSKPPKISRP